MVRYGAAREPILVSLPVTETYLAEACASAVEKAAPNKTIALNKGGAPMHEGWFDESAVEVLMG